MSDEHVARILKMLEEGKITAKDAEALIATLRAEAKGTGPGAPGSAPGSRQPEPSGESKQGAAPGSAEGPSKTFEFRWGRRRDMPFDFSTLGKQISDAVKKMDPERMFRDAGITGRRLHEKMRGFGRMWDSESGERPVNAAGWPTAHETTTETITADASCFLHVDNRLGDVVIAGGAADVSADIDIQTWGPSDADAASRLKDVRLERYIHAPADPGQVQRVELRIVGPDDWSDGLVTLRLRVPSAVSAKVTTVFGSVDISEIAGSGDVQTASGDVTLTAIGGECKVETASGDVRATRMLGPTSLGSKSGSVMAEDMAKGCTIASVNGDVVACHVEGGRFEAKSVSGDVTIRSVGEKAPIDISIESVSGDLKLTDAHGNTVLKAVSGDARLERLDSAAVQASAVSGDLYVSLSTPLSGTLTAGTVSGDVVVRIPDTSNCRYTLTTRSGDVSAELAADNQTTAETVYTGTLGTGAGILNVQTLSGDILLGTP